MSAALTLYRLQQTDSLLDQHRARLAEIELLLHANAELKSASARLEDARRYAQNNERRLRETEHAVQAQQIKIQQAESSLYSGRIHNPKELQDLQHDVASLKRHQQTLEEQQLEAMLTLDTAHEAQTEAQRAYDLIEAAALSQNASLHGEQESHRREAERLEAERGAILPSVEADHLALYEQIRAKRRGVAVAAIHENTCAACGSSLTLALVQSARFSAQLHRCTSCGRILFNT